MRHWRLVIAGVAALAAAAGLELVQPREVSRMLSSKPTILQVGSKDSFDRRHVPGAVYAGPGATPEGLELIKQIIGKLPANREIIIYCGCSPWDSCTHIRSTVDAIKKMGFVTVRAIFLPSGFDADWVNRELPIESGKPGA